MANLKNGTFNYYLTKDLDPLEYRERALKERNDMDPSYPDPNDLRFLTTPSVYTIENDSLYRDGILVGRIYDNKTGMLVEVTEVTDNTITVKDTEEQSNGGDIPLVVVLKLTGKEVVVTPPSTHDYVEIGGIKWATMNVGANSVTDTGLYFQWGDTQGYTAEQVGTDKNFSWADYKYGNGTSSPGATGMTKYNSTDGKTVLDASDDAVTAAWGGNWRMPTTAEFQALSVATTTAWTADYQGSGVSGLVLTDKTDESKTLFFPTCGYCLDGSVYLVGSYGYYWSSSLYNSYVQDAYGLSFSSGYVGWQDVDGYRYYGYVVRGVLDDPTNGHEYVDLGLPSGIKWATMNVGASSETDYGNYYMYGMGSKTYDNTDTPYAGTEDPLATSADTVAQVWGGAWHMPTQTQMNELIANTTYEWTTINGVNGGKFTAQNGNYIFIPAAGSYSGGSPFGVGESGYVWSSTPNSSLDAYILLFRDDERSVNVSDLNYGNPVRPVLG